MTIFRVQGIIFDFDGVLVESVKVKGDAFYDLYEDAPVEIKQRVRAYHDAHGGTSRYDKIRYFELELMKRSVDEARVDALAQRFSDLVEAKVIESPWVAGAEKFLKDFCWKLPLFVASATPQEELVRIVEARGMTSYFKNIHGSPVKKADHIKAIMKEWSFDPSHILMIGDAGVDMEAAAQAGVKFLGRYNPDSDFRFPPDVQVMSDLSDLHKRIEVIL